MAYEEIRTGTVQIANGGTGATTAAGARSNLGVPTIETGTWAVGSQTFRYHKIDKLVTVYGTFTTSDENYATLKNLPFAIDTNCNPESGIFRGSPSGGVRMYSAKKNSSTEIRAGGGINVSGSTVTGSSTYVYLMSGVNFCISYICQ